MKNSRTPIGRETDCTSLIFFRFRFTSKLDVLEAWNIYHFNPEWRNMASLKCHFLKQIDHFIPKISIDVKLMPTKVPKVSFRHVPSFSSYRENTGGGRTLPPGGARVNQCKISPSQKLLFSRYRVSYFVGIVSGHCLTICPVRYAA